MQRSDINKTLKLELDQWYLKQVRKPYTDYYLYFIETTKKHDGGFLILEEAPTNPEYQLAGGGRINKVATVEQNYNYFRPIINSLPVIDIA